MYCSAVCMIVVICHLERARLLFVIRCIRYVVRMSPFKCLFGVIGSVDVDKVSWMNLLMTTSSSSCVFSDILNSIFSSSSYLKRLDMYDGTVIRRKVIE